jgi:hypothetical protein
MMMNQEDFMNTFHQFASEMGGVHLPYFQEGRKEDLRKMIMKSLANDLTPEIEWVEEYEKLCEALGVKPRNFRL